MKRLKVSSTKTHNYLIYWVRQNKPHNEICQEMSQQHVGQKPPNLAIC